MAGLDLGSRNSSHRMSRVLADGDIGHHNPAHATAMTAITVGKLNGRK